MNLLDREAVANECDDLAADIANITDRLDALHHRGDERVRTALDNLHTQAPEDWPKALRALAREIEPQEGYEGRDAA